MYIILLLLSYFGLAAGALIARLTPEELLTGQIYFEMAKPVLFSVLLFLFLSSIDATLAVVISLAVLIILAYLQYSHFYWLHYLYYGFMALLLLETENRAIAATLIFAFGIVHASAAYQDEPWLVQTIALLKHNIIYLLAGIILAFI